MPRAEDEKPRSPLGLISGLIQIIMIDIVFSIDSIITAVGMTEYFPIMVIAVVVAVGVMMVAVGPLAAFIHRNPTVLMLALSFLLMIGMTLIADGFGFHIERGYIYAAMFFSSLVEALNVLAASEPRERQRARAERCAWHAGREFCLLPWRAFLGRQRRASGDGASSHAAGVDLAR